jgi:GTP-binding protein
MDVVLADFPLEEEEPPAPHPKIAIIGRPNVGKSTLVNSLLGEERVIAFDEPGTTRDSIYVDFTREERHYTLIDTAGVRRKGRVFEAIEKFSVVKTLQAIEDANVVVLVLDARQDISEQDAHLAGFVLEAGKAVVVAVNKWDGLDAYQRERVKREIAHRLAFLSFARVHTISALEGTGLAALFKSIDEAYAAAMAKLATPKVTRVLQEAVLAHAPPRAGQFRPKLRYAHQGGVNPPVIVIHGTNVGNIPDSYRRYLENTFREAFSLRGTPLRVEFRQGHNPFAEKKPAPLTPRQEAKKRRHRLYLKKTYGR